MDIIGGGGSEMNWLRCATLHLLSCHYHTNFGDPARKSIQMCFGQGFHLISPKSRSQWPSYGMRHCTIPWCTTTPNL